MNDDERKVLLQRGANARRLLTDDAFNEIVLGLKEQYYSDFLQATSHDQRLQAQARALAITHIVDSLLGFITQMNQQHIIESDGDNEDEY